MSACDSVRQLNDPLGRRVTVPEGSFINLGGDFRDFDGNRIEQQSMREFYFTIQDEDTASIINQRNRVNVVDEIEPDGTFDIPLDGGDTTVSQAGKPARHRVTYEYAWLHPTDGVKRSFEFYYFDIAPALVPAGV